MLSTRNLRLVVAIFVVFGIFAFFATSQNSFRGTVQRVGKKPAAASDASVQDPPKSQGAQVDEDEKNTLQGKPHSGTKPPYEKVDNSGSNIAEKLGDKSPATQGDDKPPATQGDDKPPATQGDDKPPATQGDDKPPATQGDDKPPATQGDDKPPATQEGEKITTPKEVGMNKECNEVDYVVMIDAGSTGSRVHVYEFNTCTQPPKLLSEEFKMLKPGLSSFDTDTDGAAKSLDPLLEVALAKVPKEKQKCTPVAVKATAGLRLLGDAKSAAILKQVKKHLEEDYPFAVVSGDGISILDGKDEGVYAWVTANFLLGNIGNKDKLPTAAVFDLGGGSTQIVFEPDYKDQLPVEGETQYKFTFGDHEFTLYQFSHLGYGLMQGRNKINKLVLENYLKKAQLTKFSSKKEAKEAKAEVDITNPCIPPNSVAKDVQVEVSENEIYVVNMKGPSQATGSQCRFLAEQVLNKDATCDVKPCSFNGIHQPSLTHAFNKNSDMFVFSFFYDRTNPIGMPSSFTVEELRDLTKSVCEGESLWRDVFFDDHVNNLTKEPQWCLDLSFITAMLHTGYDIPLSRELKTAQKIDNNELGWCLGASLPLLDKSSGLWQCRS
ncbi:GDA1 [Candida theae]|uniref:Guanosine-diphosphatase n=1 Tax=Candida theae TaxID=1198502 RepID=A0AAD5FWN8_9ASCO|nr:GDA1 [Candida theae]KAI5949466.1 GDA1 [Candida theae]